MQLTLRKILFAGFAIYSVITCYTTYVLFTRIYEPSSDDQKPKPPSEKKIHSRHEEWNPWGEDLYMRDKRQQDTGKSKLKWSSNKELDFGKRYHGNDSDGFHHVEVWGKAAIALYFWQHVFDGTLESKMDGIWHYGFKKERNIKFKFRTGPGVIPSKAPSDTQFLVLILNGRVQEKIDFALLWLERLAELPYLQKVAVIMLGNEQCDNDWFIPYMRKEGGVVDHLFIVYDSPLTNNVNFHQWPLGVAAYRGFNKVAMPSKQLYQRRHYMCNFLGTVYANSSRETLVSVIEKYELQDRCFVKARAEWEPNESDQTRVQYELALSESDLTLCPVGINTECYRIYEACVYGSVPVIEDVMTPGRCGNSSSCHNSPLCLLKSKGAPFIFIKNWNELTEILKREAQLTQREKIDRRIALVEWYKNFRNTMKNDFLDTLQKSFFSEDVT
ncbi:ribitol-5-phosphate xylosyltransferase 1-like [Ptychodera flava]|uniref:ribitol-5-phosphate xylosyltransferase 1-like n=1 Tax=Ptychodera flava TaxID=63121 RepID=UPI00396A2B5E